MRVSREDFGGVKRQHQKNQALAKRAADAARNSAATESNGTGPAGEDGAKPDIGNAKDESGTPSANPAAAQQPPIQPPQPKQPWELVDEIMNMLKTAFPLLALTMEKMVDQISLRAKPSSDEDIYRFFAALLADALQVSEMKIYTSSRLTEAMGS